MPQPQQGQSAEKPKNAEALLKDFAKEYGNNFILEIFSQALRGGMGKSLQGAKAQGQGMPTDQPPNMTTMGPPVPPIQNNGQAMDRIKQMKELQELFQYLQSVGPGAISPVRPNLPPTNFMPREALQTIQR